MHLMAYSWLRMARDFSQLRTCVLAVEFMKHARAYAHVLRPTPPPPQKDAARPARPGFFIGAAFTARCWMGSATRRLKMTPAAGFYAIQGPFPERDPPAGTWHLCAQACAPFYVPRATVPGALVHIMPTPHGAGKSNWTPHEEHWINHLQAEEELSSLQHRIEKECDRPKLTEALAKQTTRMVFIPKTAT